MKKKNRMITMITVMAVSAAIAGCGADSKPTEPVQTETEVTTAQEEVTESATGDEAKAEYLTTLGVFKSEDSFGDNERQATFTDEHGNDFIANISEETVVPEELKEGETYSVTHSEIMTMSLPGIYPQVSKIELSETKLEITEDNSQNGLIPDEAVSED